jgi:hypothetical protein
MARRIELESEGVVVVARLLDQEAPESARRLWQALPIHETLRHVRWSGNAAYILVSQLKDPALPLENRVSFYYPATIAFKPQHGELAFSYGQAQAREWAGIGWATQVADLEGDVAPFLDLLRRTQHEGAKRLDIRRGES